MGDDPEERGRAEIVPPDRLFSKEKQRLRENPADDVFADEHTVIGGRPQKIIDPDQLEKLAALFCTAEEAAAFFNVTERTIYRRLRVEPWKGAWERGRKVAFISLRRLQWRHAQGFGSSAAQMTIWLARNYLGQTDKDPHAYPGGQLPAPSSAGRGAGAAAIVDDTPARVVIEGGLPEKPQEPVPRPVGEPPLADDSDPLK